MGSYVLRHSLILHLGSFALRHPAGRDLSDPYCITPANCPPSAVPREIVACAIELFGLQFRWAGLLWRVPFAVRRGGSCW